MRLYLAATALARPLADRHLARRVARGKENPDRWREKRGDTDVARPAGPLIWMHAVGLGEVLALRGLIEALVAARPDLHVLVTSSARASGEVFDRNRPPNTIHQYLPLDVAPYVARFLDHWRPDLSVWAEQDLWPRAVVETQRRGIPLAMVNARMNARALRSRQRARGLYRDLYARFALLAAQDEASADRLGQLAGGVDVAVMGSLKAACTPLADHPDRGAITASLGARSLWCAAPTHAEDEDIALEAEALRQATAPGSLLILVPRVPDRREAIRAACAKRELSVACRSLGEIPTRATQVWLADTFGELGLWYRLCPAALIGGSFGPVEGHNPWEAGALGCAILHGPRTANFAADYASLTDARACRLVRSAQDLVQALREPDLADMATRAQALQDRAQAGIAAIRDRLLGLLPV